MADKVTDSSCAHGSKDSEVKMVLVDESDVESSVEKSDSGQGSSTDKSTIRTTSEEASGLEVKKESAPSSFELPKIVEHPVDAAGTSGTASSPAEKSPRTLFSRARDLASKGVKAITRSLSPKIDPVGSSPKKSPGRPSQKLERPPPDKRVQSEDEGIILSGGELLRQSSNTESTQEPDTPRRSIMRRYRDRILGAKKTSGTSQELPADVDEASSSGESPYRLMTAKEKRSKFAGLLNLSRRKTDPQADRLVWTPQGAAFEKTPSDDTTEELEIGSVSSPDRPEENLPSGAFEERSLADVEATVTLPEERGTPEGAAEEPQPQQVDPKSGGLDIGGRFGDYYFSNE